MPKRQEEFLSQTEFSKYTGISTRHLRNLEKKGMPHEAAGNKKRYPVPAAFQWYVTYQVELEREKHALDERAQLEIERLRHQNREAKIKADLAEGAAVHVPGIVDAWKDVTTLIRTEILRIPTRHGDTVNVEDPAAGEAGLEKVVEDLLKSINAAFIPPLSPNGRDR